MSRRKLSGANGSHCERTRRRDAQAAAVMSRRKLSGANGSHCERTRRRDARSCVVRLVGLRLVGNAQSRAHPDSPTPDRVWYVSLACVWWAMLSLGLIRIRQRQIVCGKRSSTGRRLFHRRRASTDRIVGGGSSESVPAPAGGCFIGVGHRPTGLWEAGRQKAFQHRPRSLGNGLGAIPRTSTNILKRAADASPDDHWATA